jgi:hypothetical protein
VRECSMPALIRRCHRSSSTVQPFCLKAASYALASSSAT